MPPKSAPKLQKQKPKAVSAIKVKIQKPAARALRVRKTIKKTKHGVTHHKVVHPSTSNSKDPIAANKSMQYAGAVNIAKVMARPSKNPPIRFPNLGDTRIGSVPVREELDFQFTGVTNATYNGVTSFAGIIIFNDYNDCCYELTNVSTVGALTWSSIGAPSSYNAMSTNSALLRCNAVSVMFDNYTPLLSKGGRMWSCQMQLQDSSGVTLPTTINSILFNSQVRERNIDNLRSQEEFVVNKERLSQQDFQYFNWTSGDQHGSALVFLFAYPTVTPQTLEAKITLQYEFVPETVYQVITPTKATNVTQDALATVSETIAVKQAGSGNDGGKPAGVLEEFVDAGKAVIGAGKKVWDFASDAVSWVGDLFGISDHHHKTCMKLAFLNYISKLNTFHQNAPDYCDAKMHMRFKRYFTRRHITFSAIGRMDEPDSVEILKEHRDLFNLLMSETMAEATPWVRAHLVKMHPEVPSAVYELDTSTVAPPFNLDGSTLRLGAMPVAWCSDSSGVVEILGFSATCVVTNGSPPLLLAVFNGVQYSLALSLVSSVRLAKVVRGHGPIQYPDVEQQSAILSFDMAALFDVLPADKADPQHIHFAEEKSDYGSGYTEAVTPRLSPRRDPPVLPSALKRQSAFCAPRGLVTTRPVLSNRK